MANGHAASDKDRPSFARACKALERVGRAFGISSSRILARARRSPDARKAKLDALASELELGGIQCPPQTVLAAATSLAATAAAVGAVAIVLSSLYLDATALAAVIILALLAPPLCRQCVMAHPRSAARRRASDLLKSSADAVNLMVMGIRQDASLPRAIEFASSGRSVLASELRRCTWEVVTGTHTSFEEAIHALGGRWERFSSELKTALNAIVVASREATDEGKRRSLERANRAMVAGAKRRVEEYALSLSTPSMLLFGLGILLPIMVGSFMPMLSWDIWSGETLDEPLSSGDGRTLETAMVMDILFPVVAFLVAMDAVSRRPVDRREPAAGRTRGRHGWAAAVVVGAVGSACAYYAFGAGDCAPLVLLAGMVPASAALVMAGARGRPGARAKEDEVQDLLFKVGARMLDGDNFESALHRSVLSPAGTGQSLGRRLCLRAFVMGQGLDGAVASESSGERVNALEALKVVARASSKDETDAGMMAMDIATYLRELSEIESTLKMRLRPTISMMRMTAHFLGPLVLGVTFAIYVSLGSVAGGYGDPGVPETMLMVLGLFLAEMNAVVCYFVWGIEGRSDRQELSRSIGMCMLVSQLVFVSTALLAA